MAIDLFMKIYTAGEGVGSLGTGNFQSSGSLDARSNELTGKSMELQSFEWSLNQIGEEQGGRPRSVEHVEHNEFVVTKHVDAHTPLLFEVCAAAAYLWKVKILLHDAVRTADNPNPEPYLAYTMQGVHFASYSVDSDEGIPVETIGMKYGAISVGWKTINHSGNGATDGVISRGWSNVLDIGGKTAW